MSKQLDPNKYKAMSDITDGYYTLSEKQLKETPFIKVGRGSDVSMIPTQDVVRLLQDPNSIVKTTRKDWDFKNLQRLQAQMDYDYNVDGSGVHTLRYLASRKNM